MNIGSNIYDDPQLSELTPTRVAELGKQTPPASPASHHTISNIATKTPTPLLALHNFTIPRPIPFV